MNDDELSDETIPYDDAYVIWLKRRPYDDEVRWHSDHLSRERPWSGGWVDILCDDLQAEYPCSWVWTITWGMDDDPDDDNNGEPPILWDFEYPPDLCLYRVWEHDWDFPEHFTGPEILTVATRIGEPLSPEQADQLNTALAQSSPSAAVYGQGGWSADCISAALNFWADTYAGRPDLQFVWDPDGAASEMLQRAHATVAKIRAGIEDTYLIGSANNGWQVKASEQVMDMLLDDLVSEEEDAG